MSDTSAAVLDEEQIGLLSEAEQQQRWYTAAKIKDEITKNQRDLDQLPSITACPVEQELLERLSRNPNERNMNSVERTQRQLDEPLMSDPRWREGKEGRKARKALRREMYPLTADERTARDERALPIRQVRDLLKKTTPASDSASLIEEFLSFGVYKAELLNEIVNVILNRAVGEHEMSDVLSELCAEQVRQEQTDTGVESSRFRSALLYQVENIFKNNVDKFVLEEESNNVDVDEERRKMRTMKIGIVKFIGHLYLHGIPTVRFVLHCIKHLIINIDSTSISYKNDEYVECALQLLKVVGKRLREENLAAATAGRPEIVPFDELFQKLGRAMLVVSVRVRVLFSDMVRFRTNGWVDEDNGMEEIDKAAEEFDGGWKEKYEQLKAEFTKKREKVEQLEERCKLLSRQAEEKDSDIRLMEKQLMDEIAKNSLSKKSANQTTEICRLENDKRELKKKLDGQIEQNFVLSKKFANETSMMSRLEDDKRELKKKLDGQIEQNSVLSKKFANETSMVSRLEDDKRKSTTILNKTDVVMFMLKKSHQAQVDHAKEKEKKIQMVNESKKKLEDQISVLSKKLTDETSKVKRLKDEKEQLTAQLTERDMVVDKMKTIGHTWVDYANQKEEESIELEKKLSDDIGTNYIYSDLSKKLADETSKMNRLEDEKGKLTTKLTETTATLNEQKKKILHLWVDYADKKDVECIELKKKLDDEIAKSSALSKKLSDETSKANRLENEKGKLTMKLSETDVELDQWKTRYQSWFDYANEKDDECNELEKKLDDEIKKNSVLSKKLGDETSKVSRLEDDKIKSTTKLTETVATLDEQIINRQIWVDFAKQKEKECIELKKKLDDQIEKNSDLSKKLADETSIMNRLEDEKKKLTIKLSETDLDLDHWKKSFQLWFDCANERGDECIELEKKLDDEIKKNSVLSKKSANHVSEIHRLESSRKEMKEKLNKGKKSRKSGEMSWGTLLEEDIKREKKFNRNSTNPKRMVIRRDVVEAPIWSEHTHTDGRVSYYNENTRQSQREKSCVLQPRMPPRKSEGVYW